MYVPVGVTLEPAPGDTTRPVIKQTVAYTSCNCPILSLDGNVDDLEIDQAAGTAGHAAGAVDTGLGTVTRSKLEGKFNGMYATGGGKLEDTVVVANKGIAVSDEAVGKTMTLDNVTAMANGTGPGEGAAIEGSASISGTTVLNLTNTIARGRSIPRT